MPRALQAQRASSARFVASFSQWFGLSIAIGVVSYVLIPFLRDIATAYRDLVDRELGRTRAQIEVATTYDEADRRRIAEVMSAVMGATVVADFVHNPDLLAGFKVQVGSKVFDGSLVGQVDRLSRQTASEQE